MRAIRFVGSGDSKGKAGEAAKVWRRDAFGVAEVDFPTVADGEEFLEGDAGHLASEGSADAEMHALAEGEVAGGAAL